MTRAEKQNLHAIKCTLESTRHNMGSGPETLFIVSMSLTPGQLAALNNALTDYQSAVGADVLAFLQNAAYKAGITL